MTLGIVMKGVNAVHFGSKLDFFTEFLPQLILLLVLFGYMDILIVLKWLTDFTHVESTAPSIVTSMIDVFLNGGVVPPENRALVGDKTTQQTVSQILLVIAMITIPWMLVPKPLILAMRLKREAKLAAEVEQGT